MVKWVAFPQYLMEHHQYIEGYLVEEILAVSGSSGKLRVSKRQWMLIHKN